MVNFKRSKLREWALLLLFGHQFDTNVTLKEAFHGLLSHQSEQQVVISHDTLNDEEFEALKEEGHPFEAVSSETSWQSSEPDFDLDEKQEEAAFEKVLPLVEGVEEKQEEIDAKLRTHIKGKWSLDRLERMTHTILSLAVYEIIYLDDEDVPNLVALNEALELTKRYSDEKTRKFVNGVLAAIVEEENKTV